MLVQSKKKSEEILLIVKPDMLTPRITEACKQVIVADCNGWIRHTETYKEGFFQKEHG